MLKRYSIVIFLFILISGVFFIFGNSSDRFTKEKVEDTVTKKIPDVSIEINQKNATQKEKKETTIKSQENDKIRILDKKSYIGRTRRLFGILCQI